MKKRFKVIKSVIHQRKILRVGDEVELSGSEAERLGSAGFIAPPESEVEAKAKAEAEAKAKEAARLKAEEEAKAKAAADAQAKAEAEAKAKADEEAKAKEVKGKNR